MDAAKASPLTPPGAAATAPPSLAPAVPPVNIYEGSGQLSVVLPIPGSHPDHVEVVIEPTLLRVHAECKYAQEQQNFRRHEWQVGSWKVDVALPSSVDPSRARAALEYGVLTVRAPISETATGLCRLAIR